MELVKKNYMKGKNIRIETKVQSHHSARRLHVGDVHVVTVTVTVTFI